MQRLCRVSLKSLNDAFVAHSHCNKTRTPCNVSSPEKNLHFYPTPFVAWHLRLDRWGGFYESLVKQGGHLLTTAARTPWQSSLDYTPALGLKTHWETWLERLSRGFVKGEAGTTLVQKWIRSITLTAIQTPILYKTAGRSVPVFSRYLKPKQPNSKWSSLSRSVTQAKLVATKSQGCFCD